MSNLKETVQIDPDDATRKGKFDPVFSVPAAIDVPHSEIHEGDSFVTDAVDTLMSDTDTIIFAFKTAAGTKRAHMVAALDTLVAAHLDIIEGPTWTTGTGSQNPIFNRKRLASMTSSGLLEDTGGSFAATNNVSKDPTGLAGGTVIHDLYAFGSKQSSAHGGRDLNEFILRPDTQYAFRLTADGNNNAGQLILNWYEHTDE